MIWCLEAGILLVVAVVMRRVLHMGDESVAVMPAPRNQLTRCSPLYKSLASEIDAHITILGVLLNDAIEERNSGRYSIARRILTLFESDWSRLVDLMGNVQSISLKYLPMVQSPVSPRNFNARAFRSAPMNEFFRRHGVLDQFVFRSKMRFQLNLRLLRKATSVLNEDFLAAKYDANNDSDLLARTLTQLDLYFHDLDRLSKETLLGFQTELASLPESALQEIAAEVSALTRNGVHGSVPSLTAR